jgi:hypothetical protein
MLAAILAAAPVILLRLETEFLAAIGGFPPIDPLAPIRAEIPLG